MLPFVIALSQHGNFAFSQLQNVRGQWNLRCLLSVLFLSHVVNIFSLANSLCSEPCSLCLVHWHRNVCLCLPAAERRCLQSCTKQEQCNGIGQCPTPGQLHCCSSHRVIHTQTCDGNWQSPDLSWNRWHILGFSIFEADIQPKQRSDVSRDSPL